MPAFERKSVGSARGAISHMSLHRRSGRPAHPTRQSQSAYRSLAWPLVSACRRSGNVGSSNGAWCALLPLRQISLAHLGKARPIGPRRTTATSIDEGHGQGNVFGIREGRKCADQAAAPNRACSGSGRSCSGTKTITAVSRDRRRRALASLPASLKTLPTLRRQGSHVGCRRAAPGLSCFDGAPSGLWQRAR